MVTRIARMRGLACMCLRATVVAENSPKSALQLTQLRALSGEEALHLEQVCMAELQGLLVIDSIPGKEPT